MEVVAALLGDERCCLEMLKKANATPHKKMRLNQKKLEYLDAISKGLFKR